MRTTTEYLVQTYLELLSISLEKKELSFEYMNNVCKCIKEVLSKEDLLEIDNWHMLITSAKTLGECREKTILISEKRKQEIVEAINKLICLIKDSLENDDKNYVITNYYINEIQRIINNPMSYEIRSMEDENKYTLKLKKEE